MPKKKYFGVSVPGTSQNPRSSDEDRMTVAEYHFFLPSDNEDEEDFGNHMDYSNDHVAKNHVFETENHVFETDNHVFENGSKDYSLEHSDTSTLELNEDDFLTTGGRKTASSSIHLMALTAASKARNANKKLSLNSSSSSSEASKKLSMPKPKMMTSGVENSNINANDFSYHQMRKRVPSPTELARAELDGNRSSSLNNKYKNPAMVIHMKTEEAKKAAQQSSYSGQHYQHHPSSSSSTNSQMSFMAFNFFARASLRWRRLTPFRQLATGISLAVLATLSLMAVTMNGPNQGCQRLFWGSSGSCKMGQNLYQDAEDGIFSAWTDWSRHFHELVLTSGLEVVTFNAKRSVREVGDERRVKINIGDAAAVLITGYHDPKTLPNLPESADISDSDESGLIAIDPVTGTEMWRRPLIGRPTAHDCQTAGDVDNDGVHDCIVTGRRGLLAAINPLTGSEIWTFRYHIPLVNFSLPRRLPDLDDDGVDDLLAACAVTLPSGVNDDGHSHVKSNLVLFSGRSGNVLGRPYHVPMCTDLSSVNVTRDLGVQFDCVNPAGEADQFELQLAELYENMTGEELPTRTVMEWSESGRDFSQNQRLETLEDSPATEKDSIHLDLRPARQYCPECGAYVRLWDGFAHRTLWNKSWPYPAVAFQPTSTRFETDRWDSPIEGFAFRLWEWLDLDQVQDTFLKGAMAKKRKADEAKAGQTTTTTVKPPTSKTGESEDEPDYAYDVVFNGVHAESSSPNNEDTDYYERDNMHATDWLGAGLNPFIPHPARQRRLLSFSDRGRNRAGDGIKNKSHGEKKGETNVIQRFLNVRESVIYITLNHTTPKVVRLFSQNVTQKCEFNLKEDRFDCLPHFDTQPNSMVIIDKSSTSASLQNQQYRSSNFDEKSADFSDTRELIFSSQSYEQIPPDNNVSKTTSGHKWRLKTTLRKLQLVKDISVYHKRLIESKSLAKSYKRTASEPASWALGWI